MQANEVVDGRLSEITTCYAVQEWVSSKWSISGKGFWYDLPDSKTKIYEHAASIFVQLKDKGRIVRLIEYACGVLAECAIPLKDI